MKRRSFVGGVCLSIALCLGAPAIAQIKGLDIVAVSSPGSGIDQTARAVQAALEAEKLATGIKVDNKPGGAGTVGLSYFLTTMAKRGDAILVAGMANMMGSYTNVSPVKFGDAKPLARLIGEYELVVVAKNSDIHTLDDLIKKLKENPKAVSWGGGSPGSADHLLVAQIAKAAGVDPASVNYIGHSGGGQATASILGGHVTVGVSGYGEFESFLKSGEMRALGISSEQRVEGLDIPTFIEQGIDVQLVNWRGLFAPKDISDAELAVLTETIGKMVKSAAWKKTLEDRGWLDLYQPASEFGPFFASDSEKAKASLTEIGLVQ